MNRKLGTVLVLAVWATGGCERTSDSPWRSCLPEFGVMETRLLETGWSKKGVRPDRVNPAIEVVRYTQSGALVPGGREYTASLEATHFESAILRLQLRGYGSNIDEVLASLMPAQWAQIRKLPGDSAAYMKGLETPHAVDDLAVTVWWEEYVTGGKVAKAFIIWPREFFDDMYSE